MTVAVACTALLGLLLFGLGAAITLQRRRSRIFHGYRSDPADPLYRLVRAHGNTAEYAPMLCVLMLLAGARNPSAWVEMVCGVVTISRYLQVIGMLTGPTMDKPNWPRLLGTPGTYAGGALLCLAILAPICGNAATRVAVGGTALPTAARQPTCAGNARNWP